MSEVIFVSKWIANRVTSIQYEFTLGEVETLEAALEACIDDIDRSIEDTQEGSNEEAELEIRKAEAIQILKLIRSRKRAGRKRS